VRSHHATIDTGGDYDANALDHHHCKFTLAGDGLCVGYDSGDAVSQAYQTPGSFTGGNIQLVEVAVDAAQYADREVELKGKMHD
jgi:hypothetical protein